MMGKEISVYLSIKARSAYQMSVPMWLISTIIHYSLLIINY